MKKLISIGVALALLTMVLVPGIVGAYTITPDTYAKIPFAIIGSGLELIAELVPAIEAVMGPLPLPLDTVLNAVAPWTAGPLSWTVDMLAWGMALGADIWGLADLAFGLGFPAIEDILDKVAEGLMWCWGENCTAAPAPLP